MFPKNEKTQILRFRYIFNAPTAMFLLAVKGCLCQLPQAVTPTSNIALLILCSRQAIVPLCRPGGVRAARFNNNCFLIGRTDGMTRWPVACDLDFFLSTHLA